MPQEPMMNVATKAARKAAQTILRSMEQLESVSITEKTRNDFVTEVDQIAEKEIIEVLHQAYPDHAFIAEESGRTGDSDNVWIIDPLDGTTNYIHGFPHFSISIAFMRSGKIEHGLVYDPLKQELFTASRGRGAHLNERRIRVGQRKQLEGSLIGTGFPFREKQHFRAYLNIFEAMFPQTAGMRRTGSAALDLAYVAAGRLDGFWEISLNVWDFAAGVLLIQEAGGLVGDLHGEEKFMENGNIVTGNPKIFKAMLQIIQKSLGEDT